MARLDLWTMAAVALAAATLAAVACRAIARHRRRRLAGERARRGRDGESRAERLLASRGFRLVERQPRRRLRLHVDGVGVDVEVRPDLLVERRGRRLVAEVKTGARTATITDRATRRQILEYRIALDDIDGVLLVDADEGTIREVTFPLSPAGRSRRWPTAVAAACAGAAVVAAANYLLSR